MSNILVVAIDTQIDFVMRNGLLPVEGAEAIIAPGIRYLAGLNPEEIAGVLFTFDTHTAEKFAGSPENLGNEAAGEPGFDLHCELGTPGWENVFNMQVVPEKIPVWTLQKGVFDMWEQPSREVNIHPLTRQGEDGYSWGKERDFFFHGHKDDSTGEHILTARGHEIENVDTIRIFGVASDFCVRWAIAGFLKRGFKVEVVADLTAGILRDIAQTVADEFPGQVKLIQSTDIA